MKIIREVSVVVTSESAFHEILNALNILDKVAVTPITSELVTPEGREAMELRGD
jgi:hypothetical protein